MMGLCLKLPNNIITFGIDPLVNKYKKNYKILILRFQASQKK